MDDEINYDEINELLNNLPDNFNILEETVDIDVQKDYFEATKKLKKIPESSQIGSLIEELNNSENNNEELKNVLQKLASIDSVEAFRAIEKYTLSPRPELKDWSILALQQSRMILQSSLCDEQQVFISTGLGGKNNKLRYFLIIPFKNIEENNLSDTQKSILEKELQYFSGLYDAEYESIEFTEKFATSLILFPLKAPVADMIRDLLDECNQYGDFVSEDIIITNIKKYNNDEVVELLKNHEKEFKN
jgi:hypothetical protein